MKVQRSVLASNHQTWELTFDKSPPKKETRISFAINLPVTTVAWPIFFLFGTFALTISSIDYFTARWHQYKIVNILKNDRLCERYSRGLTAYNSKRIEALKTNAIYIMEKCLNNRKELGLSIPQKKSWRDYFSSSLPKNYWKDFSWDEFLKTDFFQKANFDIKNPDKFYLQRLEKIGKEINCITLQNEILPKLNSDEKTEAFKRILEIILINKAFTRQESKQWILRSVVWLLPTGFFWTLYFPPNNRLTYEGKKHFLPSIANFRMYTDLLDAHNQLIQKHKFLTPYLGSSLL